MTRSLHIWSRVWECHQGSSCISSVPPQYSWRSRGTKCLLFVYLSLYVSLCHHSVPELPVIRSLLLSFTFPGHVVHQSYPALINSRNTRPLQKLLSSSTRALLINYFHSRHLLKPMRSLEVASSHRDTRGNTLKGARMDLLSVAIWVIPK
jgi:hypothetical protein